MKGKKGFTLVELLIVIGIIAILLAITIIAMSTMQEKAKTGKTKGLLGMIQLAIKEYKNDFGEFPPDGYDYAVQGGRKGAQALVYLLCLPQKITITSGPKGAELVSEKEVGPYLKAGQINEGNLTVKVQNQDFKTAFQNAQCEFKDGWDLPFEYDQVQVDDKGKTTDVTTLGPSHQGHDGNPKAKSKHGQDPRFDKGALKAEFTGVRDFFFWSNGRPENNNTWTPKSPMGSWNTQN